MGVIVRQKGDKCAIYARVSTDIQREKHTIQSQLDELPKVAKRNNWEIYDTYIDDGISGETVDARPAFQRLLDDAEDGKFGILLVIDLDRITRSKKSAEGALIYDHFRDYNIKIATPSETIDLQNEDQDFMAGIRREIGKWEKRKILKRTRRGKIAKLKRGVYVGGVIPLGYRWTGSEFEVDPEQAKIVRLIFDLCIQGMGILAIRNYLNDHNVPTHSAILYKQLLERNKKSPRLKPARWAISTVSGILNRQGYYTGEWKLKSYGDCILRLNPIIDKETFEKAQVERQKRKAYEFGDKRTTMNHQRLCKGIVVCGHCGRRMNGQYIWKSRKDKGIDYYCCNRKLADTCDSRRIRVSELDREVWERFIGLIKNPDKFDEMLKGQGYGTDKNLIRNQIKTLEIELARNKDKRGKLALAEVSKDEFKPQMDGLRREAEVIQEQIHNLEKQLFQREETDDNIRMAKEYFYRQLRYDMNKKLKHKKSLEFFGDVISIAWSPELLKEVERLAFEEKRDLLRRFIDGINSKIVVTALDTGFKINIQGNIQIPEHLGEEGLNKNKSIQPL